MKNLLKALNNVVTVAEGEQQGFRTDYALNMEKIEDPELRKQLMEFKRRAESGDTSVKEELKKLINDRC